MAQANHTARSIEVLRSEGWSAAVNVERHDAYSGRKHDLFGFLDILAVGPQGTIGVQVTSASNVASRIRKIESDELAEAVAAVREAGWQIEVWGWRQPRGPRTRWELHRREDVS